MHEFVSIYWGLRSLSEQLGDSIAAEARVRHNEHPAVFFNMAFNTMTLTTELLDFYYTTWRSQTTTTHSSSEEARDDNESRVILIQNMSLIDLMSAFEFCVKQIVGMYSAGFGAFKGRLYLSKIMERSMEVGIIDAKTLEQWNGLIEYRNCFVHNNAYASITHQYSYPGVNLNFASGSMMQGSIRDNTKLTEWLLRAAGEWILQTNKSFSPNQSPASV